MIKSMTGFGKATCELNSKKVSIEIRSLNSRQLDINTRIPLLYKDKEAEIRSLFSSMIERGKVEFFMTLEYTSDIDNVRINNPLARNYYNELKKLADELNINKQIDYLSLILRMPDVILSENEELDEEEWQSVKSVIISSIQQLDTFRTSEGIVIEEEFMKRIEKIIQLAKEIITFEKERINQVKERLRRDMKEMETAVGIDENRFEQELFYYIEKMDLTEEKVRLAKHCDFFIETMKIHEANGKKLNFIAQEIGREINTLGSKAMDANIQKIVVQMKDELEKIREQLGNVL